MVLALGLAFIPSGGAKAAAWVAVGAETALAFFLWIALRRTNPAGAPNLRSLWKVAVAAGVAGGAGYLLRDSEVVGACVATVAFVAVAIVTRAVPADLYHAIGFRWGEDDEEQEATPVGAGSQRGTT